ncbi:MAG: type II toxin-antitoxin system HicB family antitoxin [Candidatus Poribacteria bacterium]|nr:type II toxin-antitoxin system HicB family antitoxin [Candidatus Poribacteria bacterium]
MYYKITVILQPQPEGVYTVTCKELPELITEGRTIEEALYNVEDAFSATLEIYREFSQPLPREIMFAEAPTGNNSEIKLPESKKTKAKSNFRFQTLDPTLEHPGLCFRAASMTQIYGT